MQKSFFLTKLSVLVEFALFALQGLSHGLSRLPREPDHSVVCDLLDCLFTLVLKYVNFAAHNILNCFVTLVL